MAKKKVIKKTPAKKTSPKKAKLAYPKPSVTADIVVVSRGRVLLIQRKNPPFENQYALPGGFVDPHEEPYDAAVREAKEETNLELSNLQLVNVYGKKDRDPRGWTISVAYLYQTQDDITPEAKDDAAAVQWFAVNDLNGLELAFDHREILTEALSKVVVKEKSKPKKKNKKKSKKK